MLDYLVNYGINKVSINYEDLDVTNKLMLQDQINSVRNNYSKLLNLLDEVQSKYLECNAEISKRSKELISSNDGKRTNSIFDSDDTYLELDAELSAYNQAMKMIQSQIEFCKNDLRILNSVFYNKF